MEVELTKQELRDLLAAIRPNGVINTNAFMQLRDVDAKVKHALILVEDVEGIPPSLIKNMREDLDFRANSRFVRLKALANHLESALKFLDRNIYKKPGSAMVSPPDTTKLTQQMLGLKEIVELRWIEAQKCQQQGCHLAAVILMGSILEALLLSRALLDAAAASRAHAVPKSKNGQALAIPDWTLNSLVDVAVEIGWLKADRGRFSHALRQSRNMVHPWEQARAKSAFDDGTSRTSWEVLRAAVGDLLASVT